MQIYFVRHGESTENALQMFDPIDASLTKLGESQVEQVALRLKDTKFEKIFLSDTLRAKQTAQIINKYQNIPLEESKLIREQLPPTLIWKTKETDPESSRIWKLLMDNIHDKNFRYSDEETFEDFKTRIFKFFKFIETLDNDKIIVIGHGFVLRALLGYVLYGEKYDSHHFEAFRDNIKTVNTGITICDYSKGNGWKLVTWNDYSHLKDI